MTVEKQEGGGAFLFRLSGRFGPEEARAVEKVLATAERGAHLVLDFTRVRELQDRAMGTLADGLRCCRAAVALRGLALHQRRMLRYLGVDPDVGVSHQGAVAR